jgi:hypothetical protein
MVGSSKILTVSYGTFSCTLEGFDDPFSTMKSIAEYFRDLAAEDRYFGAEPPTPDAEMLHRIAEREVQRRVETRLSPGGVILRQLEETAEPVPAPRAEAPVAPPRGAEPAPVPAPAAEDSVASKLSRIRAVVDRARATSVPARPVAPPAPVAAPPEPYEEDDDASDAPAAQDVALADTAAPAPHVAPPEDAAPVEEPEDRTGDASDGEAPRPWEASGRADDEAGDDDLADAGAADEPGEQPVAAGIGDDEDDEVGDPRVVHLSRSAARRDPADEFDDEDDIPFDLPADDPTIAGIRKALDSEKLALDQERKEARMERRHVLIGRDPDREPAFDRILEETNTKMADREGTRRRSAIAHLKAAVAATKADRLLKRERSREIDEEEQRDYREDLAKVVRPRRSEPRESAAVKTAATAARPAPLDTSAAPLILGSSQRIDTPSENPHRIDLRPRRVGAAMIALDEDHGAEEVIEDDSAFVAFAETMGARNLSDLLEAAAAYTAFVERQPSFSRPQIMRRAAAIETDEEFTREAGLRSFGQLLRQGKIRKLQRGQFTVSENTRFRPDARIAGE